MSKKSSHILLTNEDFDDCVNCNCGASKLKLGSTYIFKNKNFCCNDCALVNELTRLASEFCSIIEEFVEVGDK